MLSHSGILREIDFIIDGRGVTHHAYTIVFRDGERATVKVPTLINEQEAALSVSAQGAKPVAWITADAIESLQADGMCALAAGRKQSAVYSVPIYTNHVPAQGAVMVDELAQETRRVDGNHSLGAGALAEALMPFLSALHSPAHSGEQEFRPCVIHYEDGDYSQMVIEDCPTVTGHPPVAVEALYDLNDRERIVGFQWYGRRPAPAHSGEAEAWRYDIQYGPDGEANYAWVYRGKEMVATVKTHHAIAIVNAMNGTPAHSGEREALERIRDLASLGQAHGLSADAYCEEIAGIARAALEAKQP